MPRQVIITTAVLVVLAALGGFWLGQRQVTLDASGVIEAVADAHVAQHGGDRSQCVGWPGEDGAVFYVRCAGILYAVDRWGSLSVVDQEGGI
ncbi:hypothetical protein [Tateyamaria sp. ANG-S1]|uniref:hypothetical protein n=1 Tax=Tateyamaria sp. ANG-S1 TaxID=1577905 RepID=UPI00057CD2F8|nr:hypothetical protein [Tateyamaria sp. ANG-S1]KIC48478.1 hypothetical protein RA29_12070 [Tateyamaria sp. ANG-S1]